MSTFFSDNNFNNNNIIKYHTPFNPLMVGFGVFKIKISNKKASISINNPTTKLVTAENDLPAVTRIAPLAATMKYFC